MYDDSIGHARNDSFDAVLVVLPMAHSGVVLAKKHKICYNDSTYIKCKGAIMRVFFCDDDSIILEQLHLYVSEYFEQLGGMIPEFACYSSGDALLNAKVRADIAFLDVEMPGVSGIHVGAKLKELNPNIKIFIVTSYPDYLDEAMRFQVFRYLSKPIDKNRLFRNLKDAVYRSFLSLSQQ